MIEVSEVKHIKEFILWLKFSDGRSGEIDLEKFLWGPVFEPLKDIDFFKKFSLSKSTGTISWPNEADFAPEFLLEHLLSPVQPA